jgi:hypothetical protein
MPDFEILAAMHQIPMVNQLFKCPHRRQYHFDSCTLERKHPMKPASSVNVLNEL